MSTIFSSMALHFSRHPPSATQHLSIYINLISLHLLQLVRHALFLSALAFTLPLLPHRFGLPQNPNRPCQPESPHASTAKRFSRMKHTRKFPHKKLVSGSFLGNSVSKQEAMTQFYRIYTISRQTFPLFASQVLTLKPIIGRTLQKCEEKYGYL